MLAEGSVARWWGVPDPPEVIAADLDGSTDTHLLVIEVDGSVAGGIQYGEETTPRYRHGTVDVYLGAAHQGHGFGSEAVRLLVDFLIHERGHHRITIDPAVANTRAVRCYESVGFRPVGMLRQYERDPSGTAHDGLLMERLADDEGPRLRAAVPTLPVSDERRAVTFLEAALGLIEVGPGLASAVGTVSSCTCGWPPTATHGAPSVTWLAQGPAGSRSAASISSTSGASSWVWCTPTPR